MEKVYRYRTRHDIDLNTSMPAWFKDTPELSYSHIVYHYDNHRKSEWIKLPPGVDSTTYDVKVEASKRAKSMSIYVILTRKEILNPLQDYYVYEVDNGVMPTGLFGNSVTIQKSHSPLSRAVYNDKKTLRTVYVDLPQGVHSDEYEAIVHNPQGERYLSLIIVAKKSIKLKEEIDRDKWKWDGYKTSSPGPGHYTVTSSKKEDKKEIDFTSASFLYYPIHPVDPYNEMEGEPNEDNDESFELRKAWLEGAIWYQNQMKKK